MTSIENDPEFQAWAGRVERELIPKLEGSAVTISLVPRGASDIKFAVELGLSLMMDKPIILAVQPGTHVPPKLAKIADEIVEIDLNSPNKSSRSMGDAVQRVARRYKL